MTVVDRLSIMASMNHKNIIALWPSASELARDLGQENAYRVHKWSARDSIPPENWLAVVEAGTKRGLNLTLEQLARGAASRAA